MSEPHRVAGHRQAALQEAGAGAPHGVQHRVHQRERREGAPLLPLQGGLVQARQELLPLLQHDYLRKSSREMKAAVSEGAHVL